MPCVDAQVNAAAKSVHAQVMDPEGKLLREDGDLQLRRSFSDNMQLLMQQAQSRPVEDAIDLGCATGDYNVSNCLQSPVSGHSPQGIYRRLCRMGTCVKMSDIQHALCSEQVSPPWSCSMPSQTPGSQPWTCLLTSSRLPDTCRSRENRAPPHRLRTSGDASSTATRKLPVNILPYGRMCCFRCHLLSLGCCRQDVAALAAFGSICVSGLWLLVPEYC